MLKINPREASSLRDIAVYIGLFGAGRWDVDAVMAQELTAHAHCLHRVANELPACWRDDAVRLRRLGSGLQEIPCGTIDVSEHGAAYLLDGGAYLLSLADALEGRPASAHQYSVVAMAKRSMSRLVAGVRS